MNCDILHIKSTAVDYTAATGDTPSSLVITLPNATLTNGQIFTLDICQQFPVSQRRQTAPYQSCSPW